MTDSQDGEDPPVISQAAPSITSELPERQRVPETWRDEWSPWFAIAWPVCVTFACRVAMTVTGVAVVGHLGADYLAAASLANVWMIVTG
jgi:Na+-driven multidrug efflux pump